MGWVNNRLKTDHVYETGIPALWNDVRDAIGCAVDEFNVSRNNLIVERKDCTARSQFCMRLTTVAKSNSRENIVVQSTSDTIEVYIEPSERLLKSSKMPGEICAFRASSDLERLEFFVGDRVLNADQVCQMAIEDFLFPKPGKLLGVVENTKRQR